MPQPTNPNDIENSIQIKETSPTRISVNPETGEIDVWHAENTVDPATGLPDYHGNKQTWDKLANDQKRALIKAGLVDKNGKVIKPPSEE